MSTDSEAQAETPPEKPRGKCTGCAFSYRLGTARSGEHKGKLVVRKHNSRTGPGLCPGAQQPPQAEEWQHCTDTECKQCCGCSDGCTINPCGQSDNFHAQPDLGTAATPAVVADGEASERGDMVPLAGTLTFAGHEVVGVFTTEGRVDLSPPPVSIAPDPLIALMEQEVGAVGTVVQNLPDPWTSPAPVSNIPDQPVSMQPEPDRDRWGRYLIGGAPHTRVTTFVKAPSSTYALEEWAGRMITRGLTLRPDLLALAHGLDVKRDRTTLNSIAAQAKEAAGQKVAANLGSAYHAFTERLDAGLMTLDEVPAEYRPRVAQYADAVRRAGLVTQTEWIERTTAVCVDTVSAALPVAGMLDRIFRMPSGELVIGDLKTGSSLEYGRKEIESQLAIYAHGVNTHGLYDWNTKSWQPLEQPVRTDYGLVIHLPADADGCEILVIDLKRGWRRAQLCGEVMADQKQKVSWVAMDLDTQPAPPIQQPLDGALALFRAASSREELGRLAEHARKAGVFTEAELFSLGEVAAQRWEALTV